MIGNKQFLLPNNRQKIIIFARTYLFLSGIIIFRQELFIFVEN